MKRLILVGSDHHDVKVRSRLRRTLERLKSQNHEKIGFVAVEFAQTTFEWMLTQRPTLLGYLLELAPEYSGEIMEVLAETYGHEAEFAKVCFPDVKVIWLEPEAPKDKQPGPNEVRSKAYTCVHRLRVSSRVASGVSLVEVVSKLSSYVENHSRELAAADPLDDFGKWLQYLSTARTESRDPAWFARIREIVTSCGSEDSVGLVIVGESHLLDLALPTTLDVPPTLFCLLKSEFGSTPIDRIWIHQQ